MPRSIYSEPMRFLSVRIPAGMAEQLAAAARRKGRPVSEEVRDRLSYENPARPDTVIVGERSPDGREAFAGRAGLFLARLCGMRALADLRRRAQLVNLLPPGQGWDADVAERLAAEMARFYDGYRLVLCGSRVARAFGAWGLRRWEWFPHDHAQRTRIAIIPHPSGKNREWNLPETSRATREFLATVFA